jgi:hypothetical protein
MFRRCFARVVAVFLFLLAGSILFAQNNTGRISGTISDSSGAVIPGAQITAINQATKVASRATTNSNGYFVIPNLQVGAYDVAVEATGFRKAERVGYDLVDNGHIAADFKLEVGGVSETVQVTEVLGETVNTVSGELAHTIDAEQVQDLALNGRNYLQLVSLIPGVALLDEDQMATTTSLSVTTWAANGGRPGTSHLMIDGGMNLDSGSNGSQVNNVGVDFVREVSVKTSAFSAEFGRNSGAAVNAVTKSGGNTYNGSLIYTFRNDALDAKDYFAPVKPILRFNDFGWNLGGPVALGPLKKGKIFFFAGEEWKRIRKFTSPTRRTMPTLAEIGGDFSDRTSTTIRYPGTTTPIPNKNVTALMTPDGKAVMAVYGAMIKQAAAYSSTPTSNNATFQVLNPFNWRQDIARIDYNINDKNTIYFRWIHDNYDLVDPFGTFNSSQLPNTPTARNRPGYGPQLSDLWTVSPHVINEAKINSSWNGQRTPMVGDAWKRGTYSFQFPLIYGGNGLYPDGIPNVTVNSFASYNGAAYVYLMSPTTDIAISDNVTWMHGLHTVKGGVMIVRNRKDQNGRALYDGSVAFNTNPNTNTTNYALADAALGNFSTYTEANRDNIGFFRFSQYEGFVQDSWRVHRRLSLEIGMRFSHSIPTYATANNLTNFVPSLYDPAKAVSVTSSGLIVPNSGNPYDGLIRAGDGVPQDQTARVTNNPASLSTVPAGTERGFYPASNLWMPRFSFAWAPFSNGKTAFRGGFGVFHDRVQGNLIFSQSLLPPFSLSSSFESGNLANPSGGTQSAQGVLGGINAVASNLKVPTIYNWNFGVQRTLAEGLFLDLSYTGTVGHHLLRQPDINFPSFDVLTANYAIPSASRPVTNAIRPYKGYSTIRMYMSDASSNYNSLQTYLTRRKGNLVTSVSYTWSHALADASADGDNPDSGLGYQNRHYFYGPTTFDRRHILVVTYTYRIPLFRKRHGLVGGAFGRWEVSGITRAQSGSPLTPVGSSTGVTRRADYIGGEVGVSNPDPNHWFNTAAFKTAPTTALGNAGIGMIRGPGLYLWDLSIRKEFRIAERWRFRLEGQSFNLLNHPNFRSLDVTTSDAAFGTVSGSGPARNIQFAGRLSF